MTPDPQELLTPKEYAQVVRVHEETVRQWVRDGRLDAEHFGRQVIRIRRDAKVKTLSNEPESAD